nr:hypothetical protein [Tanacetum cinerariifolium]
MIIKKGSKIAKAKVERKALALKAKIESSYEECSTSRNIPKDMNQGDFVGGSWSGSREEDDEKVKNETCLVPQASSEIYLGVDLEHDEWIKDSGCSKHMTGNQKLFSTYKAYNEGNVIFGSNLRGNIIGKGQICDNKFSVTLSEHDSEISKDGKVIGRGCKIVSIRTNHGREFDNEVQFGEFCNASGITHNFSAPRTPQSNGVEIEKSLNVTFDESPPPSKTSTLVDDELDEEEAVKVTKKKNLENDIDDETLKIDDIVNIEESRNHLLENVIGNLNQRTLRPQAQNQSNFFCFRSTIEPKNVNEALAD